MSSRSILPPSPTDLWIKKWIGGVTLPSTAAVGGIISIVTRHSYTLGCTRFNAGFHEIFGFDASLLGLALLGFAVALFFYCFASEVDELQSYSDAGTATGLVIGAVFLFWCNFRFMWGY